MVELGLLISINFFAIVYCMTCDFSQHKKHTNISSTNQGHGLCYYFFIVEVKKSRPASGIMNPYQKPANFTPLCESI
jgi:hypothetical protein